MAPKPPRTSGLSSTSLISDVDRTTSPETEWQTVAPVVMGDYELMEELGRGAMGVVHLARQKSLGRMVALKMVLAGQTTPTALARFQQEARSAAALDHPGIVPLFDFGEVENQPYYTMAYIEGDSLTGLVHKQGPLPPGQAAHLISQIADAVAYAHERGIIHRDLKPDNILIDRQGHPRITDFGLARRLEEGPNLTSSGSVMGTPSYMSPEQAKGLTELTPAVDIYSLGAMLHAVVTGESPFSGTSVYEVLLKVTQEAPPPLRQINPDLPEALERIVLRCLEKDPPHRYATAADLAADLREWLDNGQAPRASTPALVPYLKEDTAKIDAAKSSQTAVGIEAAGAGLRQRPELPSRLLLWLAVAGVFLVVAAGAAYFAWPLIQKPAREGEAPAEPKQPVAGTTATPKQTVKARKAPPALPAAQVPVDWAQPARQDFKLKVSLLGLTPDNKGIYTLKQGQKVRFVIDAPRDVHIGIWSLQSDGVVQLLPNRDEKETLTRAGVLRPIPGNNAYKITAMKSEPAGQIEFFRIVASTVEWKPRPGKPVEGLPFDEFRRGQGEHRDWEDLQFQVTGTEPLHPLAQALTAQGIAPWAAPSLRLTPGVVALGVAQAGLRGVKLERLEGSDVPAEKDGRVSEVVLPYRVE
jgi:serine/threonine protein kinase